MTIRARTITFITLSLSLLMAILATVIIRDVHQMVYKRSINLGEEHTLTLARSITNRLAEARHLGRTIQSNISNYQAGTALASSRRAWLERELNGQTSHRDAPPMWVVFKPDGFDGLDAENIDNEAGFGDDQGVMLIYSKDGFSERLPTTYEMLMRQPRFQLAMNEGRSHIISQGQSDFNPQFGIAREGTVILNPIFAFGTRDVIGVLGIEVNNQNLFSVFTELEFPLPVISYVVHERTDLDYLWYTDGDFKGKSLSWGNLMSEYNEKRLSGVPVFHVQRPVNNPARGAAMEPGYTFHGYIETPGVADDWGVNWSVAVSDMLHDPDMDHLRSIVIIGTVVVVFLMGIILNILLHAILNGLRQTGIAIEEIASGEGDLTKRIRLTPNDEVGKLAKDFNTFTAKLQDIIGKVKGNTRSMASVSSDLGKMMKGTQDHLGEITDTVDAMIDSAKAQTLVLAKSNESVKSMSTNIKIMEKMVVAQSAGITQGSATIEEMIASIGSINKTVEQMGQEYKSLGRAGAVGRDKQAQVSDLVKEVVKGSTKLQEANTVIEEIANQTNLLAMNAAIEAAHAGDVGKGFAVVADEIRSLAESASEQSKSIGSELRSVSMSIFAIKDASGESEASIETIFSSIEAISTLVHAVEDAMNEQSTSSQEVLKILRSITENTREVKDAASNLRTESRSLGQSMSTLTAQIDEEEIRIDAVVEKTKTITTSTSDLASMVSLNNENIAEISQIMNKFKV
jgi:methyl-accepting chemotaxis protein